jgi:hypothetical protein
MLGSSSKTLLRLLLALLVCVLVFSSYAEHAQVAASQLDDVDDDVFEGDEEEVADDEDLEIADDEDEEYDEDEDEEDFDGEVVAHPDVEISYVFRDNEEATQDKVGPGRVVYVYVRACTCIGSGLCSVCLVCPSLSLCVCCSRRHRAFSLSHTHRPCSRPARS